MPRELGIGGVTPNISFMYSHATTQPKLDPPDSAASPSITAESSVLVIVADGHFLIVHDVEEPEGHKYSNENYVVLGVTVQHRQIPAVRRKVETPENQPREKLAADPVYARITRAGIRSHVLMLAIHRFSVLK